MICDSGSVLFNEDILEGVSRRFRRKTLIVQRGLEILGLTIGGLSIAGMRIG